MNDSEWLNAGLAFYGKSKYEQAIYCFTKGLEFNKKNGILWHYKGICLERMGDALLVKEEELTKKIEANENIEEHRDKDLHQIEPKNKSITFGSYSYYQTTSRQLYWGYSHKKTNDLTTANPPKLSKSEKELISIKKRFQEIKEEAEQCKTRAKQLGVF